MVLKETIKLHKEQRHKSEMHYGFTKEINKIALNSRDDKRTQSIDLIKTCAYGTSKDLEITID